jgi:valyl-tRNA synthetase
VFIKTANSEIADLITKQAITIVTLINSGDLLVVKDHPVGCVKNFVSEDLQTFIKVAGLIDIKLEIERVNKKQEKLD